jgi:L-iditol 2-dehydrogenase
MKAVFPAGAGVVELREVPKPRLREGEVLLKMRACGICGTDIEKTRGETHTPQVLGHEVSGLVDEIAGVMDVKEGARVVVHHHVSCGVCYYCKSGSPTLCVLYQKTNLDPCGFAEYFRVPEVNVLRGAVLSIPDRLSFEEASFVEPLGCCLRNLACVGDVSGKSVAVFGVGSTGVLMLQLLKARNASLLVSIDISPSRLRFSQRVGADVSVNPNEEDLGASVRSATDGRGVDIAIVATGSVKALENSFSMVRRGGIINLFGMPTKDAKLNIDPSRLFINEIRIVPSYSTTEKEMKEAIKLVSSGRVKVAELISHRFTLADSIEAFRVASDPERSVKVIVNN